MTADTIESETSSGKQAPEAGKPKAKRKSAAKHPKPSKKARRAPTLAGKAKAGRANKKGQGIAMMQRVKGVTLAEIMNQTGWQAHTVRAFVSILGSKGGHKIESSKSDSGERTYRIAK